MKKLLLIPLVFILSLLTAHSVIEPTSINFTDGTFEQIDFIGATGNIVAVDFNFSKNIIDGDSVEACFFASKGGASNSGNLTINETFTDIAIPLPVTQTPTDFVCVDIDKSLLTNNNRIGLGCEDCANNPNNRLYIGSDITSPNSTSFFFDGVSFTGQSLDYGIILNFNISIPDSNLNVFQSKNPIEILEEFTLFANYTNATSNLPIENAFCFANSSQVGGGEAGFGRGVLGIGSLSTVENAVSTQINDIFGNNTLRVDIDGIPLGKASYSVNFRFHANNAPLDDLRVFTTCHPNNLSFSNFTFFGQVNISEAVVSTSVNNDTIWGFKNIVLFGEQVASSNCSIVFESQNSTSLSVWHIADTVSTLNLNNSFTSDNFGETYTLRTNADERSPFVDVGFGLDVPNETTMTFNSTSGLYFLPNIRHGRPFDFIDRVFCSADNFINATDFVITNVEDNIAPIVQITSIDPTVAVVNVSTVTIQWIANDPELLINFINVSFPNGSLLIQSDEKPLILTPENLTVLGNYTVIAFANDTGGLFTIANSTFEVADIDVTPPIITLISPANNTINNAVPLNITFNVTDNFLNDIICILENSTIIFDTGTFTQAVTSILVLEKSEIVLDQAFPNLELTCFDNTLLNNSATLNLNYSIDTFPPVIFPISPSNNNRFNKDIVNSISIKANCTDVTLFRFNMTISNSSDTIASFETRAAVNNFFQIEEQLSIIDLGVGNYTIDYICSDPHTKNDIPDYIVSKQNSQNKIKWATPSGNEYELRYIDEGVHVLDYGSSKHEDNSKYKFWYVFNETEDGTERTFTFELENRKFSVDYLSNSPYKGHFIMQNNWLDFEFNDPDAEYFIILNENNNYEISITTTKTALYFYSTGELNIATLETQFEIFFVEQVTNLFQVTECRTDTGSVILLALFFAISFFFIYIGLVHNIGFIGFFGAIMMMILSLFIAACIIIFATMMVLLSLVLIIYFVFHGFFPTAFGKNNT